MAPFVNPLRHIWFRDQTSASSSPTNIANLDGMTDSDVRDQPAHDVIPQQHVDQTPLTGNKFLQHAVRQHQAIHNEF